MNLAPTTTNQSSSSPAPTSSPSTITDGGSQYRLPDATTLQNAARMSAVEDKPIMMDYWVDSLKKTVIIGVNENTKEKLLVKSVDEYTSPISKIFKVSKEYIIMTENSIYIVDADIKSNRISA